MRPTKHYYSSSATEEKETVTANTITTTMMDNNNYESLEEAAVSSTSSQSRRLNGIEEKEEEKQCHNLEGDTIEINQRKKRRGLRGKVTKSDSSNLCQNTAARRCTRKLALNGLSLFLVVSRNNTTITFCGFGSVDCNSNILDIRPR